VLGAECLRSLRRRAACNRDSAAGRKYQKKARREEDSGQGGPGIEDDSDDRYRFDEKFEQGCQ